MEYSNKYVIAVRLLLELMEKELKAAEEAETVEAMEAALQNAALFERAMESLKLACWMEEIKQQSQQNNNEE